MSIFGKLLESLTTDEAFQASPSDLAILNSMKDELYKSIKDVLLNKSKSFGKSPVTVNKIEFSTQHGGEFKMETEPWRAPNDSPAWANKEISTDINSTKIYQDGSEGLLIVIELISNLIDQNDNKKVKKFGNLKIFVNKTSKEITNTELSIIR